MRHFQGRTHNINISCAVKGVVIAPLVPFKQLSSSIITALERVKAKVCTKSLGQLELGVIDVNADYVRCPSRFCRLNKRGVLD